MTDPEQRFLRLARLARSAPNADTAPEFSPALATRVLARVRGAQEDTGDIWARLCLRAVPIAAVVAAGAFYFGDLPSAPMDERVLAQSVVEAQFAP